MSQLFSINSKIIKKAILSIKKFKADDIYIMGDGSEVYFYSFSLPHCKYIHFKVEDVKVDEKFALSTNIEELHSAIDGATGDVIVSLHTKTSIEVDANTKKSYLAIISGDSIVKPRIKFKEDKQFEISSDRIEKFSKAFTTSLISSWSIIEDFYHLHIEKEAERLLSPNMIFYKSTSKKDLELSIPGFIIKHLNPKNDALLFVDDKVCRITSGGLSVDFTRSYCSPAYSYELSKEDDITINTAKLLGVVSAMDKTSDNDILEILYIPSDNSVVFQTESSKWKFDQPVGKIKNALCVKTSCSNMKKAIAFMVNNEIIKMKLFIDSNVIKGIELLYDDGINLEYVILSAKR